MQARTPIVEVAAAGGQCLGGAGLRALKGFDVATVPAPQNGTIDLITQPSPDDRLIRLVVIDADSWGRSVLAAQFVAAADIAVVGGLAPGDGTTAAARGLHADVALLSTGSVDANVLRLIEALHADPGGLKVVLLTDCCDPAAVLAFRGLGANCYLVRADELDLATAVRVAAGGAVLLSRSAGRVATTMVVDVVTRHALVADACLTLLSPQQRTVLALLAQGKTNAAIASDLTISAATVKFHVSKLLERLDLSDRGQLIAYAHSHGISATVRGAASRPRSQDLAAAGARRLPRAPVA